MPGEKRSAFGEPDSRGALDGCYNDAKLPLDNRLAHLPYLARNQYQVHRKHFKITTPAATNIIDFRFVTL